jgi:hypothetical protein
MTCINKNDLNKHILYKHTIEKPFKCTDCSYECKTENDLQKHINHKHNTDIFEYQCNECDFKTKEINLIKRHMLKFHLNDDDLNQLNDGQPFSSLYMCHICNKVYNQGSTLSKHLKTKHDCQWPSGHSRFHYKLESDGFYRLQTLRYESIELVEKLNKDAADAAAAASSINSICGANTSNSNSSNMDAVNSDLIEIPNYSKFQQLLMAVTATENG